MSKQLSELCSILVAELYGSLASRIISTLLYYGRLPLLQLQHRLRLPRDYVRSGLVVLVRQNLIYHWTSEEDGVTYYESNSVQAYNLVRLGRIVRIAGSRHGEQAGRSVTILQEIGHAKVRDIIARLRQEGADNGKSYSMNGSFLTNGDARHSGKKAQGTIARNSDTFLQTIGKLLKSGVVQPLREPRQFASLSELRNEGSRLLKMREEYRNKVLMGKKKDAFENELAKTLTLWRTEDAWYSGARVNQTADHEEEKSSKRRKLKVAADEGERASKRQKIETNEVYKAKGMSNQDDTEEHAQHGQQEPTALELDENLVIRLSHEKCDVEYRSDLLVRLSARCLGEPTSKVYAALLHHLEAEIPRCFEPYGKETDRYEEKDVAWKAEESWSARAKTSQVVAALEPSLILQSTIAPSHRQRKTVAQVKDDSDDDQPITNGLRREREPSDSIVTQFRRGNEVLRHLELLAEHPHAFVHRVGTSSHGEWQVDFRSLTKMLIQQELETIIAARFGTSAVRLVRILQAHGSKLDEKQLAHMSLLRQKDLRAALTSMQEAGYVETQEVPKDNSRQPNRTIFLWFFDQERCRQLVLDDTYKAMVRILQRTRVEKEKMQGLIDKARRTDVTGHEDEYLNAAERTALQEWRDMEGKLLTQLSRQDELVALLRDFLPPAMM